MTAAIRTAIRDFIVREFTAGADLDLADGQNFIDAGIVDSFGLIQLIAFVERQFSVKLSDDDLVSPEVASIDGLAAIVVQRAA